MSTVPHVEPPTMPGAGDQMSLERTLAQRSALVGAGAVQGVEAAVDIEQGHDLAARNEFAGLAGRAFVYCGDSQPAVHPGSPFA